jgi:hypothetical protein
MKIVTDDATALGDLIAIARGIADLLGDGHQLGIVEEVGEPAVAVVRSEDGTTTLAVTVEASPQVIDFG